MADSAEGGKSQFFRAAAIFATLTALIFLALVAPIKDKGTAIPLEDTLNALISGLAAAAMLYASRHSAGRSKKAWLVLAAAVAANTFGEAAWGVIEVGLHQNPPSPESLSFRGRYRLSPLLSHLCRRHPAAARAATLLSRTNKDHPRCFHRRRIGWPGLLDHPHYPSSRIL